MRFMYHKIRGIEKKELFILLAVASIIFLYFQYPAISDYTTINDDVRVHYYPIYKIIDPSLFKEDVTTDLFLFENPLAFVLILLFFSYFFDMIILSKVMSFIIFLAITIFAYKVGRTYFNKITTYLFLIIFLIQIWSFPTISGGLPRSFSYLFILAFLYYHNSKQHFKKGISFFASLLLYPPSLFITWTSDLLLKAKDILMFFKKRILGKPLKIFLTMTIILFLAGVFLYSDSHNNRFGTLADYKEVSTNEAFSKDGRIHLFPVKHFVEVAFEYTRPLLILNLIFFIPFLIINKRRVYILPPEIWALFISGLILHYIAGYSGLLLHDYTRYVRYTFPLFLTFFFAKNVGLVLSGIKQKYKIVLFIIVLVSAVTIIIPETSRDLIDCNKTDIYSFLASTHKDTLIAGHPLETSCVPLFSRRKVFTSQEAISPYYSAYYNEIKNRTFEFLRIFYSEDIDEILTFCANNKIEYLLVDYKYLNNPHLYRTEPFFSFVKNITKNISSFALLNIDDKAKIIKGDDYYLIRCQGIKNEE